MEHAFTGPAYTVGIEEELMIVDADTLDLSNSIESMLESPPGGPGHVQAELMESVLEVATTACSDVGAAADELRALRRSVSASARERGLAIGSAGTHPFALWEEQRIVPRDRYRGLVAELGFVARQELIFGMHVHVGVDDPDKAVHVVNGLRLYVPLFIALATNSPFWRADATGLMSSRMPIFRQFPRSGLPPRYRDFADYAERIDFMVRAKVIGDYTRLWYDVRLHPWLGTVEVRAMDAQTRLEHTVALAALIQAVVRELCEDHDEGRPVPSGFPSEMLDENRWLAARKGLDAELVDLPGDARVPARDLVARMLEKVRGHARAAGAAADLAGIEDLLENGTGATRQLLVHEANNDLGEVMAEIVAETTP